MRPPRNFFVNQNLYALSVSETGVGSIYFRTVRDGIARIRLSHEFGPEVTVPDDKIMWEIIQFLFKGKLCTALLESKYDDARWHHRSRGIPYFFNSADKNCLTTGRSFARDTPAGLRNLITDPFLRDLYDVAITANQVLTHIQRYYSKISEDYVNELDWASLFNINMFNAQINTVIRQQTLVLANFFLPRHVPDITTLNAKWRGKNSQGREWGGFNV